ncbi:MAG: hypothetical protein JNM93_11355 [Bacteriovoracaceae bacterium]|nr:hypothetical protein [Bacteriovoracaceae bacterium]
MKPVRTLLLIISGVILLVTLTFISPFFLYYTILRSGVNYDSYTLPYYSSKYFLPSADLIPQSSGQLDEQSWTVFHIKDLVVPLPTKDPLLQVVLMLEQNQDPKSRDTIGLSFINDEGREFSKVYFLENALFESKFDSQKLFQIPVVVRILQSIKPHQIWHDLFTKNLNSFPTSYGEIVYNLYLLQLRQTLFPKEMESFVLNRNGKIGIVKLNSPDKDFHLELIMTFENGLVYSYLFYTNKSEPEAQKVRDMFLVNINYKSSHKDAADFIYQEFKNLSFEKQTSQVGMLYLFSAWSHWPENQNFVRQMVEYLERGHKTDRQLRTLYEYALKKYGMTFSQKAYFNKATSPEVELQRQVELEKQAELKEVQMKLKNEQMMEPTLTEEEEIMHRLKKSKQNSKKKSNRIKFD